ncbi:heavy-metal-associated domain-containing protein [Clostridium thermopalmarium]|uniref:Heavy-metal-associated domain protein n=1 Tax=Clostridium thermopalmarium DSM 5974 TaxID=1121340 RepID=A0A2T0ALX0_9CLOT|nr:heavy metal-associated domain-containing protein [Clostridium thermopalmarium]PRR69761.1 Heavy-metal-associated domain protein [Clostridium thermopalmarium DSM 5974]PVZ20949.1 copper chaperone CopZ [Clostridium thermopalmarium DSM 5974]
MKKHTVKFKQENILCHRCVINAAKALSQIKGVLGFNIDIDSKIVQVMYIDNKISKEIIKEVINDSIIGRKTKLVLR